MSNSRKTIRPSKWCCDGSSTGSSFDDVLDAQSVEIVNPTSPFGELLISDLNPALQVDFVDSSINSALINSHIIGSTSGSSISTDENEIVVTAGTSSSNSAYALTKRMVPYQPGQGTIARFTARFSSHHSNSDQFAGLYNYISGYRFGYNGDTFGIHYRRTGKREIRALTITTGSSSLGLYATVTINGEAKQVLLTSGGSTTKTAYELGRENFYNVAEGWISSVIGDVVYFISTECKPYSGSFAFSHATAVGSFSLIASGELPEEDFIEQSSWNIDPMNGLGPSRLNFDPSLANVYEIKFQYLGYGNVLFSIEGSTSTKFIPVHLIKNAGNTNHPTIRNPNFFLSWSAKNTGSVASPPLVYGASGAGFIAGVKKYLGARFSYALIKDVSSTALIPAFTIKASHIYNGNPNVTSIKLDRLSLGSDVVKPVELLVFAGANLNTANFVNYNSSLSRAVIDTTATSVDITNARQIFATSLGRSTQVNLDLRLEEFDIQAGEEITFCINSHQTSANQFVSISLSWSE